MDTSIIKEQITEILESISEQAINIQSYKGKIPQIELDVIKENLRKLYEYYHQLDHLNSWQQDSDVKQAQVTQAGNEKVNEKSNRNIAEDVFIEPGKHETSDSSVIHQQDDSVDEDIAEEELVHTLDKKSEKHSVKPKSDPDLFSSETHTLSDKLKNGKKLIHETLKNDDDNSIAAKMQKNPIQDLKSAIGINEKFLFINELFKGKLEEYKEAIDNLNNLESLTNAMQNLDHLKEAYDWEEDTEAFIKLSDFVHRRYLNA